MRSATARCFRAWRGRSRWRPPLMPCWLMKRRICRGRRTSVIRRRTKRNEMNATLDDADLRIWGPYRNYHDEARLQYGRRMWRIPEMRARLLTHWLDDRHPWHERFIQHRVLIEEILT